MKKLFFAALVVLVGMVSCKEERPKETDLTILFTTDVHGQVLPLDFLTNSPCETSMAQVYSYVQKLRERGETCILLDAGDMAQGQPSTYYYNYVEKNKQHIVGRAADFVGYDAVGIGENDIQFGEKIYKDRMPQWFKKAELLCANAYDIRTKKPMFKPYTIIERNGVRVAVIAMASPDMRIWLTPMAYENIDFKDLEWTARTYIQEVKEKENPDVIVGIFHVTPEISKEVIEKVSGFDIVFCGQDHTSNCDYIYDSEGNTVYFLQPLPKCDEVGRARIHLSLNSEGKYDKKIAIERISMRDFKPSPEYVTEFLEEISIINEYLDRSMGTLTASFDPIDCMIGPASVSSFIHDMQLWVSGAEVSFTNFVSTYVKVPAGKISMRDLFNIYQYENQIWTLQMKGHEILGFLEHAYAKRYDTMTGPYDNLLSYELDENGEIIITHFGPQLKTRRYNYASVAGVDYIVDVSKPAGQRITITGMSSGEPFDPEKIYRVVMPDHLAVGGGGHTYEGLGWNDKIALSRVLETFPNDIRMNFSNYIKMHVRIVPKDYYNWKVVPEDWFEVAASREKLFLEQYLKQR